MMLRLNLAALLMPTPFILTVSYWETAHKFLHRTYDVPQSLLHEGINTIAVRLVTYEG